MCYLSSAGSGATYATTKATLPTWPQSAGVEILFDILRLSDIEYCAAGIVLYLDSTPDIVYIMLQPEGQGGNPFAIYQNGTLNLNCYTGNIPAVGQLWNIKLDLVTTGAAVAFQSYYSANGGSTWNELLTSQWPGEYYNTTIPSIIAVGPYFNNVVSSATTGIHVGNIVVQDIAPATPNCSISKAYVTTGGQSVAFFFETGLTGSGGSRITPNAMNYAPSFFQNGISVGVGTNAWITGYHSCAIVQFQLGIQINPGDTVTVSTPASWMSCGTGNAANQVTHFSLTNYTGQSCFGTESLAKTFRPGFNMTDLGPWDSGHYSVLANWRYKLGTGGAGSYTFDGYLTSMAYTTQVMQFLYPGQYTGGNNLDSAGSPGVSGYWAIKYDDNYLSYSGAAQTFLSIIPSYYQASNVSVSQDSVCTSASNTVTVGSVVTTFAMYLVSIPSGASICSTPLSLQITNANKTPYFSNLWIVAPGDFTFTEGVPLTAGNFGALATNPYALSSQFLRNFANSCGSMRWLASTIGFGSWTNLSEVWQEHQLTDFSWNNANYSQNSIGLSELRALNLSVSPYVYGDFNGLVGSSFSLTLNTGVNVTATTFSINAGSARRLGDSDCRRSAPDGNG